MFAKSFLFLFSFVLLFTDVLLYDCFTTENGCRCTSLFDSCVKDPRPLNADKPWCCKLDMVKMGMIAGVLPVVGVLVLVGSVYLTFYCCYRGKYVSVYAPNTQYPPNIVIAQIQPPGGLAIPVEPVKVGQHPMQ